MTKPAFIFDLDGTLVDTAPDLLASINWLLGREGRTPVEEDQLRRLVGRGAKNLIAEAFLVTGDPVGDFEIDVLHGMKQRAIMLVELAECYCCHFLADH